MTAATLLAFAAGAPAAAGIADLAAARSGRRRAKAGRRAQRTRRLRPAVLALRRRGRAPPAPRDLADRLDAAGARLSVADAMAIKAGAALAGALAALAPAASAPGRLGPVLPLAGAAAGFLGLDL